MTITEQFDNQEWAQKLARRGRNFRIMVEHIANNPGLILETGTAWQPGNWEWAGQSTLIWDWVCSIDPHITAYSVDIRQEAIDICSPQTKHVNYICGDSVTTLNNFKDIDKVKLLYLDSYDWNEDINLESSFHHMMELATIWGKLSSGCMIVVDDRWGDMRGKHWLIEAYMKQLGIEPVFKNKQMGWIKP